MTEVVAFVPDLMDRSRFPADACRFLTSVDELSAAIAAPEEVSLVVVDLGRRGVLDALAAAASDGPRVVGFASHVDDELIARASALGCEVLPRSRFFRDLAALLS